MVHLPWSCGWIKMEILEQIGEKTYPSQIQQGSFERDKKLLVHRIMKSAEKPLRIREKRIHVDGV